MYSFFLKRFIDIVLSLIAIFLLSPLLVPIILGLLLTGEHYVFYLQERIGFKNKKFKIYKFATMLKNSPNMGTGLHTTLKDSRILPLGGFLRKTKINELPQLFNIFLGSMSIIGPRPLVDKTFEPYSDIIKKNIYNVKPGLSGIGSIVFRDEESLISLAAVNENPHDFYKRVIAPYKGELELWYHSHRSVFLDSQLIFMTAWTIVFPETRIYEKWFKDLPKQKV
jgi:lipopolysaccharide/colanic/teichoic acid biosynthesis glycosyltransferase